MEKPNSTVEITKALIAFQKRVKPAFFDASNEFYKSKYASLGSVIDTIKEVAGDCGLSWTQFPVSDGEGRIGVETVLLHESGESISRSVFVELPPTYTTNAYGKETLTNKVQETGKVITYLRRYGLSSAFGIYSDEDNDGNAPDAPPPSRYGKAPAKPTKPAPAPKAPQTKQEPAPAQPDRPYTAEQLVEVLTGHADKFKPATSKEMQTVVAIFDQSVGPEDRHTVQEYLFGATSIKGADQKLVAAVYKWLDPYWDAGSKSYLLPELPGQELQNLIKAALA